MEIETTTRSFARIDFIDRYGAGCSLQESSLATEDAIWFGCNSADPKVLIEGKGWQPIEMPEGYVANTRMHLTRDMVRELLPYLQQFAEKGTLR